MGWGPTARAMRARSNTLKVPVGTLLYDDVTGDLVHDFAHPNETIVIAKGFVAAAGGTSTSPRARTAGPRRAWSWDAPGKSAATGWKPEAAGRCGDLSWVSECREVDSDLAAFGGEAEDCELCLPDAGAEPPGVVSVEVATHEQSYTVADLPGLIEGAHLGAENWDSVSLKHIERTSVIVHLVDVSDSSDRDSPVDDYKVITDEVEEL